MKLETTNVFKRLSKSNPDLIVLSDEQVKQTQKVALEAVHDIVDICDKYDINYHLTGGSALGVVRHKGFIPWDDDVDIDMARKDIKKFLVHFKKKYGDKYWIHTPYSKGQHCMQCCHIRRKGTVFQSTSDPSDDQCGICVDVLVMENTFDNPVLRTIHGLGSLALGLAVSCRRCYLASDYILKMSKDDKDAQSVFKKKIMIGKLLSFFSLERWTRMYVKWNSMCHNENTKYVTVATGRNHFFKETYLRKDFYETTTGQFEDMTVKIPKNTDKYLKHMFGDYMKIPPKDQQDQHVLVKFEVNI